MSLLLKEKYNYYLSQTLCCLALLFLTFSGSANHLKQIKSAVAPEFVNGLHAKYLAYIADKLDMSLVINPMPFARRLQEMRTGNIDIMVGLVKTESREDEFYYLQPSYESLSFKFYSLKENKALISEYSDLANLVVGINRHSVYFEQFDKDQAIVKVNASGLENNIQLLLKKRVDVFIHYQQSTEPLLAKLELADQIVTTEFQVDNLVDHYITISKKSPLVNYREQIEKVIADGVANNDFVKIRLAHYQEQMR